jgi:hypothetical protein
MINKSPGGAAGADAGEAMYPLVYWAGLATFAVWTALSALSAFSALHGF